MYWSGILTTNLPNAPGTTDYILLHRGPRHLTRPRLPGLAVRPRRVFICWDMPGWDSLS